MSFRIRKAEMKDAAVIAEVHVRTWKTLYNGLIDMSYLSEMETQDRLETWKANLAKVGRSYMVFIAEENENILGFSTLGFADEMARDKAEMYSIYLDPKHHGRGVGGALFRESAAWAQNLNCRKFYAWVFKAYTPGHEFYKAMGGRLISGSEKNLVIDGTPYPIVSYEWVL